jgi:hypothetical protein
MYIKQELSCFTLRKYPFRRHMVGTPYLRPAAPYKLMSSRSVWQRNRLSPGFSDELLREMTSSS